MCKIVLLVFSMVIPWNGVCQRINTVAGNGSVPFIGDGVEATVTGLGGYPYSCAVDKSGNLFIGGGTDYYGNRVFRVTACGGITVVAGMSGNGFNGDNQAATNALLNGPRGISVDSQGDLYIADVFNSRIRRVDAVSGNISTVAGNGISSFGGDLGPATDASLNQPANVCIDKNGVLYIVDAGNFRIRKVDTNGVISTLVGCGIPGFSPDGTSATAAEIEDLYGICLDRYGNVYFEVQDSFLVRKVDSDGIISTIAGNGSSISSNNGGLAKNAGLNPYGITCDTAGDIFVAGFENNDVREITRDGLIFTIAGTGTAGFSGDGGPAVLASVSRVYDVAADESGHVFFTDVGNLRVREILFDTSHGCSKSAVMEITYSGLTLTPNPVETQFSIKLPVPINNLTVTNYLGQAVLRREGSGGDVDVSGLPAGVYVLEVVTEDGNRTFEKFVKE